MNKDKIRNILNYESELNPKIWENIEQELHPKRRFGTLWLWSMLGILLVSATALVFINSRSKTVSSFAIEHPSSNANSNTQEIPNQVNHSPEIKNTNVPSSPSKANEHHVSSHSVYAEVNHDVSSRTILSKTDQTKSVLTSANQVESIRENLHSGIVETPVTTPPEETTPSEYNQTIQVIATPELEALQTDPIGCPKLGIRSEKRASTKGFFAEFLYGPGYAFTNLNTTIDDRELLTQRDQVERVVYDHRIDARLFYQVNQFELGTGISISKLHEQFNFVRDSVGGVITVITIDSIRQPDGSFDVRLDTQRINRLGRLEQRRNNTTTQIDIPLILGYQVDLPKMDISIRAGAIINLLTNYKGNTLDTSFNSVDKEESQFFKDNWGLGLYGSIGIHIPIAERLHFTIQPSVYRTVNPINTSLNPIEQKFWRVNLMTGLKYDF